MEKSGSKLDDIAVVSPEARSNRTRPSSAASVGQLARMRQGSLPRSGSLAQPQGTSNWISALHQVRAGQPGDSFGKMSLFKQTEEVARAHYGTASAASLGATQTEKRVRPQTAHIRSATMGGTEMSNNIFNEPIQEKRTGSAIKQMTRKSMQRVQSANLKTKRKIGHSRQQSAFGGDFTVTGNTMKIDSKSVRDFVTDQRGGQFAMKAYRTPHTVNDDHQHIQNYLSRAPKTSAIQLEANKKKLIPDSAKYPNATKHRKWSANPMFTAHANGFQKFLTAERITITDRILARKSLREPGPSTYKNALAQWKNNCATKLQDMAKSTTGQLFMLDAAKFKGKEVPGCKYKIQHSQTSPRSSGAQLYPVKRVPGQQIKGSRAGSQAHIIKKSKGPSVGCYEDLKAIAKTQETTYNWHWGTEKKDCKFITMAVKKAVPGPGHYAKKESAQDRLSTPLLQFRKRRC